MLAMSDVPSVDNALRGITRQILDLHSLLVIARRSDPSLKKEVSSIAEKYKLLSASIEELREAGVFEISLDQHTTEYSRGRMEIGFNMIAGCYSTRHPWIQTAAGQDFPERLQLLRTWLDVSN